MNKEEKDLINLKIAISPEKYMKELQQENQKLKTKNSIIEEKYKIVDEVNQKYKEVIDKAVEYINDLYFDFYNYECDQLIVGKYMVNDLLDILKGADND